MKIIIFDFEVFKYDTLLGAIEISENENNVFQSWDLEEIQQYYYENENSIWVGHNNLGYDNPILECIIKNNNPYLLSRKIVDTGFHLRTKIPKMTYDTMKGFYSLKLTELTCGKNISISEVDFNLDRPLTEEEKLKTESYNRDDLSQTYDNFLACYSDFELRIELMKEFGLKWNCLTMTETQIAAAVLKAKKIPGIENQEIHPKIYSSLKVQNKNVLDFYLKEKFMQKTRIKETFCGCEHLLASGGIHGALHKVFVPKALYFDVSGYYNLVMLNYDLLPRTMSNESKELYRSMYFDQLKMKGIPELTKKRWAYKTVLLSVFGSMTNEYTDFYDPWKGRLVTVTGEIFLVDLLEKLEGKVRVIQSNTDGIIAEPFDWNNEEEIVEIIHEWEKRTGFTIEIEKIENVWQRDVNNYCYLKNGKPNVRGEAMRGYEKLDHPVRDQVWTLKEAQIITRGIGDMLLFGISPEETVEKFKDNLRAFQFIAKKNSFDYLTYETKDKEIRLKYGIDRVNIKITVINI